MPKPEIVVPSKVVYQGPHWSLIERSDGELVLQHRTAHVFGTGEAVNMASLDQPGNEHIVETLQHYGPERLLVRCLILDPDGSIHSDAMGVSPGGEPVDPFCLFGDAAGAAGSYMRMNQDVFERHVAEAEEEF